MAVVMSLGGNAAGDGFLLGPLDSTYEAEIALSTDDGTNKTVTLQAAPPNAAGLLFTPAAGTSINITGAPTVVATVHATTQSASRGDTTIQVLEAGGVVKSFTVTCIKSARVNFRGRFEARFDTDGNRFNYNAQYKDPAAFPGTSENVGAGWTWALEGEPAFVPAVGSVPEHLDWTDMGRVIRLNNPIALRSHAAPVVSVVDSITGKLSSGPDQTFTTGDPLIGLPVNFGPDTYFAGNQPKGTAQPEEYWQAQNEPLALFEIRLGVGFAPPSIYFRGASAVGPYDHKATSPNETTRAPDSRPRTPGVVSAAALRTEFGLPGMATFSDTRVDLLVNDYNLTPPEPQTRNLRRRINHLLGSVSGAKLTSLTGAGSPFSQKPGNATWDGEDYDGKVDAELHAWPGASPGTSSVVDYMRQFFSFDVHWQPFAFHSDELCGHHKGWLRGDVMRTGNHIGDPHTHTVNGKAFDFQSVGEFTLLRDGDRMEVQVRQTPVATQHPITDDYSGLTACVSIITAVAARIGRHRVAMQPGREGRLVQFYLDGKPTKLSPEGIDLDAHRVSAFDANGETGLRIDYEDGTVVTATPSFWNAHNVWYIDVSVSNTQADEGVMGFVPKDSWLPRLSNGTTVGPKPASLHDRYVQLYQTFADSWRVTDATSLFVYAPGTSTKTFTDVEWPAGKPPCKLKPEFQIPGVQVHKGMPVADAEKVCAAVKSKDLHANCVFDVATTGDETFVRGYVFADELRHYGTAVSVACFDPPSRPDRSPHEGGR